MKKAMLILLLAALALPAAAAADEDPPSDEAAARVQTLEVSGPLLLKGKGRLRGELLMANPSETRAVVFAGRRGGVKFVDLAGDLRVKCQGRGASAMSEDDEGHKVFACRGVGGRAKVHGSHFEVKLIAAQYGVLIPAGVTGTLTGHFRTCTPGESCADGGRKRGGEQRTLPPRVQPPAGQPTDEEIDAAIDAISGSDG